MCGIKKLTKKVVLEEVGASVPPIIPIQLVPVFDENKNETTNQNLNNCVSEDIGKILAKPILLGSDSIRIIEETNFKREILSKSMRSDINNEDCHSVENAEQSLSDRPQAVSEEEITSGKNFTDSEMEHNNLEDILKELPPEKLVKIKSFHPKHIKKVRPNGNTESESRYVPDSLHRVSLLLIKVATFCAITCSNIFRKFKSSAAGKILFGTTQPVHVIAALTVTLVSALFFPYQRSESSNEPAHNCKSTSFIYLLAFSLHLGSQFWMTFVSGLCLYFSLGRHAFGEVQKILFPKYFGLNCFLSAVTLIQFGRLHITASSDWNLDMQLQVISLAGCFLLELLIRLYLVPPVLQLITIKTEIEKSAGVGNEVGSYDLGPLVNCPHYMSIHHAFRKVHLFVACGNVLSMMCSAFHLNHLSNAWLLAHSIIPSLRRKTKSSNLIIAVIMCCRPFLTI